MSAFIGTWHIQEMEQYDKEYFNIEVQAFIKIKKQNKGEFQFGSVTGYFHGKLTKNPDGVKFEFLWEGSNEGDDVHGGGWVSLQDQKIIEGEFRFFDNGDDSRFTAKKITSKTFVATKETSKKSLKKQVKKVDLTEDEQDLRIKKILGKSDIPVSDKALIKYLKFLKSKLQLPTQVKGMSYYQNNKYKLLDIDYDLEDETYGLMATVKPLKEKFHGGGTVPLCDLENIDKKSLNYKLLDDYAVWFVNNR